MVLVVSSDRCIKVSLEVTNWELYKSGGSKLLDWGFGSVALDSVILLLKGFS